MSNEVVWDDPNITSMYFEIEDVLLRKEWSTVASALVTFAVADFANYDNAMAQTPASSGRFVGSIPVDLPAGTYRIKVRQMAGGTPAITDPILSIGDLWWNGTVEIEPAKESTLTTIASYIDTEITRILGLVLHNHVEDDIVRDANGLKTSATIYLYDSAANATTHDKVTGVIGKYTVTPAFTSQLMSSLKSVQVI